MIVGIDLRAVAEEWQQSRADDLDFEPPPGAAPAPVPVIRAVPEDYLSREERTRVYEERKAEPEPEPDVPLEPAPGTLYDGVPAEERRALTRWLMG